MRVRDLEVLWETIQSWLVKNYVQIAHGYTGILKQGVSALHVFLVKLCVMEGLSTQEATGKESLVEHSGPCM